MITCKSQSLEILANNLLQLCLFFLILRFLFWLDGGAMLVRWCHKITVFQIMFNYCSPPLKEEKACPHTRVCVCVFITGFGMTVFYQLMTFIHSFVQLNSQVYLWNY